MSKRFLISLVIVGASSGLGLAPVVPPIDPNAVRVSASSPGTLRVPDPDDPVTPVNLLSGKDARLTGSETQSVSLSKQWINAGAAPAQGDNGAVIYTYGSTLPTVVCSPLHVCDVALEPGESINDIHNGDKVRWKVYPAVSGTGALKTTHLIIKATDTALVTNLNVATDRRTYIIKLVSRKEDWMPLVSFAYPEDAQAQWEDYRRSEQKHEQSTVLETGENVSALDFNYRITGDKVNWRPLRVYNNGSKTYVQFPSTIAHGDLPALVALGTHDTQALVNYRMLGDRFEVDKLLTHAALIRGVGKTQERIEITYAGSP